MGILQSHISEHISLLAREEVEEKNAQVMQEQAAQFGGQVPPELMQQFQMQNEKEIAARIVELTEELVAEEEEAEGEGHLVAHPAAPALEVVLRPREPVDQEAGDGARRGRRLRGCCCCLGEPR